MVAITKGTHQDLKGCHITNRLTLGVHWTFGHVADSCIDWELDDSDQFM